MLLTLSSGARADDLSELARRWAAQSGFSGSLRIEHGNQLLVSVSAGDADSSGTPIGENTAFWIGSLSKQFAAVATLRLAEQQRLDVKAPITRYFPELKPEAFTREGIACSVEHLLSHTCGLPRELGMDRRGASGMLTDPARAQQLFDNLNDRTPKFVPGTAHLYSNVGYSLIGLLVQRVAGMPYEQYLQQTLWGPLGMRHTGIRPRPDVVLARGQLSLGFGSVDAARWALLDPNDAAELGASGNLYSTTGDLLRWSYALHHGQLLQPASYQSLIEPRHEDYGLGIATSNKPFGKTLFHLGTLSPHSTSALLVYVPERDLALAAVSNRAVEVSSLGDFGNALLSEISHTATDVVARPPSVGRLLLAALPILGMWLAIAALAAGIWHYCRRRDRFARWSWWLRYHGVSLALLFLLFRRHDLTLDPWLLAACALALLLAVRQRWWALPVATPGKRARAYFDLATQLAGAGAIVWLSPWGVVLSFAGVCVLPGLALAWLHWKRAPAAGPSGLAAHS